ncbi:MAG TPA: O-antigen ligase family protein [Flavisolibacter sp.]|nr:O-antigen ligase family protein [Flavisolibacter sp.]
MGISIDRLSKQQLIFLSMILMLVSLFTSRFLLSVGFVLFLFLTCFHKNMLKQLVSFLRNPFLFGMSFLFLIPFITWFWTDDKSMWMHFVRIKLPLFLFPIAFAGNWQLSARQWSLVAYIFLILVFAGCCWSLWQYVQNIHSIHEQYLKAKVFPTPLENDHVRFSLMVCIAVVCSVLLMMEYIPKTKWLLVAGLCIFFIVYLHVLSARTGLVSLYIFLLLTVLYLLLKLRKTKWVISLLVLIIAMPVAAWFFFPTFQNRIHYNVYDLSNARENKYVPGGNDANRILSLKAGWNVLREHPFGVGADVVDKTYEWYDKNIPAMVETDKLSPSSEPLMYAGFAGWIGFFSFFVIMLLPFFQRIKTNYFSWFVLNLIMAFSLLFDIGIEVQFGVFIYAFIVLWWWKWLGISRGNEPATS